MENPLCRQVSARFSVLGRIQTSFCLFGGFLFLLCEIFRGVFMMGCVQANICCRSMEKEESCLGWGLAILPDANPWRLFLEGGWGQLF